ncbi:MAG: N-acetyltransferase [Pseudomonadota bacterium]
MLEIRLATPDDHTAISVLVVHTFGQPNEHKLVQALRTAGDVALEMVADDDGRIVGHICFSRFVTPEGWWALAPMCVVHDRQGQGIGSEMVRYGLDHARQAKAKAVVVLGDPIYYKRFGFVFDGPATLETHYPKQYTGLFPLDPGTAAAEVALRYPPSFEQV